ncbi:hypothetical protein Anapl_09626 [Anas platyrhynchos]|uniref:Uncharacterized protein n=1 Tax=Anas platyrhynchos TaxID=8839 RepID=R0L7Q2_ANAPL|nr:hypothetical protein Anapl_09626 [Anas platyrhynchos]
MDYYRKILRFAQAENFPDSFPRTQEPLHRGTSNLCLEVPFHRAPSCGFQLSTTQPGSSNVLWFQVPNTDGAHKTCATDRECTSSSALVMAINYFFHPQRHQEPIFLVNLASIFAIPFLSSSTPLEGPVFQAHNSQDLLERGGKVSRNKWEKTTEPVKTQFKSDSNEEWLLYCLLMRKIPDNGPKSLQRAFRALKASQGAAQLACRQGASLWQSTRRLQITEPAQDFSTAQAKLTVSPPKITDGTGLFLPATEKWGIAVERLTGSTLLILPPPGTDTSQLSQLLGLGILPIVSTPTLGAAAVSVNLFFPVLIRAKLGVEESLSASNIHRWEVFLHSSEFSCAVSHNRDYNAIWLHTAESLLEIREKYLNTLSKDSKFGYMLIAKMPEKQASQQTIGKTEAVYSLVYISRTETAIGKKKSKGNCLECMGINRISKEQNNFSEKAT